MLCCDTYKLPAPCIYKDIVDKRSKQSKRQSEAAGKMTKLKFLALLFLIKTINVRQSFHFATKNLTRKLFSVARRAKVLSRGGRVHGIVNMPFAILQPQQIR
jgi:hypothetical protein